jgi:hypothetical protein
MIGATAENEFATVTCGRDVKPRHHSAERQLQRLRGIHPNGIQFLLFSEAYQPKGAGRRNLILRRRHRQTNLKSDIGRCAIHALQHERPLGNALNKRDVSHGA